MQPNNEKSAANTSMELKSTQILPSSEDQYTCSICLSLLKNPKTLQCSHTFCHTCISTCYSDHQSCPLCRRPICENPSSIPTNSALSELIQEHLKKSSSNLYSMTSLNTGENEEKDSTSRPPCCVQRRIQNLILPSEGPFDRTFIESRANEPQIQNSMIQYNLHPVNCLLRVRKLPLIFSILASIILFAISVIFI